MIKVIESLRKLTDQAVITQVKACVSGERKATAILIATLSEFDVRRLYLGEGYGSLFDYCMRSLHLSERATCSRIAAARLSRRFPIVLDLIADSRLSLTVVSLLARHLNESNYRALLDEATYKSAGEMEEIVARLTPKPDAPAMVRRVAVVPQPVHAAVGAPLSFDQRAEAPTSSPRLILPRGQCAVIKPLAPDRYKVQFTVSGETRAKLRAVQDLLRHSIPNGDIGLVFDRALSALLADLEKKKLALVARPAKKTRTALKGSRLIPASVRRAVWARDKGRCAFVGKDGRCRERGALELHHVKPFAAGGEATVENIELRCRAHNAHEADLYFGAQQGP